jgi:hypothetical protein
MDCIICQDSGSEPLKDNTSCPCKYKRHSSCWIDYVHSKTKVTCPICRIDLTVKSTPKTSLISPRQIQPVPYTPEQRTIPDERGQETTYQELNIVNQSTNSYQNITVIEVHTSSPVDVQNNLQLSKFIKAVVVTGVLVAIVVLIIVLA